MGRSLWGDGVGMIFPRVAQWLGLRDDNKTGRDPIAPPSRDTAVVTNPKQAARIGAVYSAVSILAAAIEQLGVVLERDGVRIEDTTFIRNPDPDLLDRSDWLHQVVTSLAYSGNAYLRVWRDNTGQGSVARVLNPGRVWPFEDQHGRILYSYNGRDYTREEITHLRLHKVPGEILGLGPIQAARAEVAGHRDLTEASTAWVRESGQPSGLLSTEQSLTPDQRKELLDSWNKVPAGRTRLMSSGISYEPITLSPKDAQFLESRRFSKTEIMDLFGIPGSLTLGIERGDSQTYANVAQDWLGFVRFRLMRYVIEIESALTSLVPRGQKVRLNVESLLRADAETRFRIHSSAITAGVYSPEYAREIEHIPDTAAPTPKEPTDA